MHLIVGLGNPEPRHARQRHNVGFRVLDRLAMESRATFRDEFAGRFAEVRLGGEDVGLLAPLTYMNRSGEAVQPAMRFFRLPLERLLLIHDELDLPFGTVRLKRGGGAAGHNGLRSVIEHCGGADFGRVRIGIGRPSAGPVQRWVLSDFGAEESAALEDVLDTAARASEAVVTGGLSAAMNTFNARR